MKFFRAVILVFLILLPCIAQAEPPVEYDLDVSFDIPASKIIGVARLPIRAGREVVLTVGDLRVTEVQMNRQQIHFTVTNGVLRILPSQGGSLAIGYEGIFKDGKAVNSTNYGVVRSVIDERGISLTDVWYPRPDYLCIYRLKAVLPGGYTALSEAEHIRQSASGGMREFSFDFPHPAPGITLVASNRYEEIRDTFNAVEIHAYFFRGEKELAKTYIDYTKRYLKLYTDLIGPYPYKRFSIAENFLPSGYSMPAFTLLGRDVVKLPFIVETSLGHEILHQWFGNSVYIDYEKGNWAEGLTTYLADHLYEEQKGRGWEYRKQLLVDYASYVNGKSDFPLRNFRGREDHASKAIGYGKAAMVFHMLRNTVGEDVFNKSLRELANERRFQRTSWEDIRKAFERNYGKDLGWFFTQWIDGTGMPEFSLESASVRQVGDAYEVSFDMEQKTKPYVLDVPVIISYADGRGKKSPVRIDKDKNSVDVPSEDIPEKVFIDEDYDIARTLTRDELPPVVSRLLGDEKLILAAPAAGRDTYRSVIEAFREKGAAEKEPAAVKEPEIKVSSLILIGNDNPLAWRLFGRVESSGGFSIVVKGNPLNPQKVVAVINGKSKDEVDAAFGKIFHYGKYSVLAFDNGRNTYKKTEESQRGIGVVQREQTAAIDVSTVKTLTDVIENASKKKIVYVGEYHDRFAHHDVQLQVIKGLYAKNKLVAIGMEMFERQFQPVLDDYLARKLTEREFLKRSEYFKRWSFDYNLYKPILDYAKAERIPVVALNLRREIVEKVSKGGLDALSDEEKKEVPQHMDLSTAGYRERLREVFEKHGGSRERNFDFFYQSQILWDETMSQSIDNFFKGRPDFEKAGQMVVVVGSGHLVYGDGIPKRTFRRNGYDYVTILNDTDYEKDIANYLVFPKAAEGPRPVKLMVVLKEEGGRVSISDFSEGSISEKAGLKAGDVILSLDNIPVRSVDDVRIHLFYKKKGDAVKVRVLRKRVLFGDTEKEFDVTL